MSNLSLEDKAQLYCGRKGVTTSLVRLGEGTDGSVWRIGKTAIKISHYAENHFRELDCYRRLRDGGVTSLLGFEIPRLEGHDDELLAIEMGIVQPPYLLDFGKAYLDTPPDYARDPVIMQDWLESKSNSGRTTGKPSANWSPPSSVSAFIITTSAAITSAFGSGRPSTNAP